MTNYIYCGKLCWVGLNSLFAVSKVKECDQNTDFCFDGLSNVGFELMVDIQSTGCHTYLFLDFPTFFA